MKNIPVIISVAPNGSRKTKKDHPHLPITPKELAKEAKNCQKAGATLIHLHVRNKEGKHTLDVSYYRKAIKAIRNTVGDEMIIQVTSEAGGIYSTEQQMEMVEELKPEAVSISINEIMSQESDEEKAQIFLEEVLSEKISPQYVVYSDKELERFFDLKKRGIIPGNKQSVLFVLGKYNGAQSSAPQDLVPFIYAYEKYKPDDSVQWSACAFGRQESMCMLAAAVLGGHVRIGFENNLHLINTSLAQNNAELIQQFCELLPIADKKIATIKQTRKMML